MISQGLTSSQLLARQIATPEFTPSQIRLTLAPAYFGSICGWLFFGFVLTQFYKYIESRSRDPIWLKSLVIFTMLVVLLQVSFETYSGYQSLIVGWGDAASLAVPPKFLILDPFLDSVLAFIVQNFYVWRIWAFTRSIWVRIFCAVIVSLTIIQTVGAIGIPALFFAVDIQADLKATTNTYNYLWLICGAVIDISIAICMTIILSNAKSRMLAPSTKSTLGKLIRLTIQTGSLTAFLAIVIIAFFSVESKIGLLQTFAGYMLGKSYVLSFLANLNIRSVQTKATSRDAHTQPTLRFERNRTSKYNTSQGASFLSTRDVGFSFNPSDLSEFTAIESQNQTLKGVVITKQTERVQQSDVGSHEPEEYDHQDTDSGSYHLKRLDITSNPSYA